MSNGPTGNTPESGVGRTVDDAGADTRRGMERGDTSIGDRQAIEGREEDDLAAGTEAEALERGMRSTPSAADVRSDDQGVWNGEPR